MDIICTCTDMQSGKENTWIYGLVTLTPTLPKEGERLTIVLNGLTPEEFNQYNLGQEYTVTINEK